MEKRKNVISNFIWRFLERIGAQGITLLVSIVLARILDPNVYGTVALVMAIIAILNVFVDSGLATALIQKESADDLDFSSVFWFNIAICAWLYLLLYISSGYIADFYKIDELEDIIRVLGLCVIISGIKNVQQAYVSRHLLFKKFFGATLGGTLLSGIIGVILAYRGFGVWAIVYQNLLNQFIDTVLLWITVRWRPQLKFSYRRLRGLVSFGWKLLATSIIDSIYSRLTQFIIGKIYSSSDLAYYNQGYKLPSYLIGTINSSVDSVLLPILSTEQNDINRIKVMTRQAVKVCTYLVMPLMAGLAACGYTIVKLFFTEKWLPCVPYLQIFCMGFAFYPIESSNANAIKALGRSDITLKCEIIKKGIGIFLVLLTMNISTKALACSITITFFVSQVVNSWPNRKLLGYGYIEQIVDIIPQTLLALFMFSIVTIINNISVNTVFLLIIQLIAGVCIYIFGSYIFKIDSFYYVLDIIKNYKR